MQELTGMEYLKAEIACKHDKAYEKAIWDDRIAYFHTLNLDNETTFTKASNSIGLRAAVMAYNDAVNGVPSGYMISLDACSSGLQFLSLLVSCPKSWNLCGGVSERCIDSYVEIYDSMGLHGSITRKQVKDTIMTSLYGSVAIPESTFGSNVDMFYDTMKDMAPGAWDLNLSLQELWDDIPDDTYSWTLPDNFFACIETKQREMVPFTYMDKSYELPTKVAGRPKFHKGLGPNLIHSVDGFVVREMYRRCMFDKQQITNVMNAITNQGDSVDKPGDPKMVKTLWDMYKKTGFLSVRILDYLCADTIDLVDKVIIGEMIMSLPNNSFNLVSVHDCFRCHPNHGNDLRRQYNTIMADINDSKLMNHMAREVTGIRSINAKKVGHIDRDLILEGDYLLA